MACDEPKPFSHPIVLNSMAKVEKKSDLPKKGERKVKTKKKQSLFTRAKRDCHYIYICFGDVQNTTFLVTVFLSVMVTRIMYSPVEGVATRSPEGVKYSTFAGLPEELMVLTPFVPPV